MSDAQDAITCKRLTIVNDNNEPRIEMSADFKGNGAIKLRNGNAKGGILIGFDQNHDAVINLVNEPGIVEAQIISSNGGQVTVTDKRNDLKRTFDISGVTLGDT